MTLFRAGQFKALWERPNIILRYGSFDPAKRAIALAKAGNLGDAVRALASEGVLDPKEHIEKLKQLHPDAPLPAVPDPVPKSRLTQPFNKADFQLVVKHAKWKKAADALGWRMDHVKISSQEALNVLFPSLPENGKGPSPHPREAQVLCFFGGKAHPY